MRRKLFLFALSLSMIGSMPVMAASGNQTSTETSLQTKAKDNMQESKESEELTAMNSSKLNSEQTSETTNELDTSKLENSDLSSLLGEEGESGPAYNSTLSGALGQLNGESGTTFDGSKLNPNLLNQLTTGMMEQYSTQADTGDSSSSFSQMFSQITGQDLSNNQMFNLSNFGTDVDTGKVNLEYQTLASSLSTQATNNPVSTNNASSVFSSNYGNAWDTTIKAKKIPSGFSPERKLKSASNTIDKTYSKEMKSSIFKQTKGQINVSGTFAQAAKGPSKKSLDSAGSLKSKAKSSNATSRSNAISTYYSQKQKTAAKVNACKGKNYDTSLATMKERATKGYKPVEKVGMIKSAKKGVKGIGKKIYGGIQKVNKWDEDIFGGGPNHGDNNPSQEEMDFSSVIKEARKSAQENIEKGKRNERQQRIHNKESKRRSKVGPQSSKKKLSNKKKSNK